MAAFCISSESWPKCGFAIFSTERPPSAPVIRKLRSWWLPSSAASPLRPNSSSASRRPSASSNGGETIW
jgi:hypothetical protein